MVQLFPDTFSYDLASLERSGRPKRNTRRNVYHLGDVGDVFNVIDVGETGRG